MEEKKNNKKINKVLVTVILILLLAIIAFSVYLYLNNKKDTKVVDSNKEKYKSEYKMSGNGLENFDLYFLKLENNNKNMIYSPLSIKYALSMLNEGAASDTKLELSSILGNYKGNKYINNANMSFANALFVRDTFKESINKEYIDKIMSKYNAEVIYDSFANADNINNWIKEKTLNLIPSLMDNSIEKLNFALINALGINMEWNEKFFEEYRNSFLYGYVYENASVYSMDEVLAKKFENIAYDIAGLEVAAIFNNYDIVNELGEDKIRATVSAKFREYLNDPETDEFFLNEYLNGDKSEENINKVINDYLDKYINDINKNYKTMGKSTDFSIYVDDSVKVFAKDLKEYNGTKLQYIGIMPRTESLNSYIKNIDKENLEKLVSNLKELKNESFKDKVVTKITGYIPRFKFEYDLNLMEDLKSLGVKSVFDSSKANLSGIGKTGIFINDVKHKSNIEFTQDGIKASAATIVGGNGSASGLFYYSFDVPIEEIDITFDRPYMFMIRNKNTGEIWFMGSVYEPLKWTSDLANH